MFNEFKMKSNLFDRNIRPIKLNKLKTIHELIEALKSYFDKNPTKRITNRIKSLFASETFIIMLTEGQDCFRKKMQNSPLKWKSKIHQCIQWCHVCQKVSILTFSLCKLMSIHAIDREFELLDDEMFRP